MTEANLVRRGIALPTVGNPAAANHILKGYEVVTADGELLVGTLSGTNGLANYGGFPSITASNWHPSYYGYTVGRFDDITSEIMSGRGLTTSVSGTTLTTYFVIRPIASSGGGLSPAPQGMIQFNPFSKTCSLRDILNDANMRWEFDLISAEFSNAYAIITASAKFRNSNGTSPTIVTLTFRKSYSAVQTINIPSNL